MHCMQSFESQAYLSWSLFLYLRKVVVKRKSRCESSACEQHEAAGTHNAVRDLTDAHTKRGDRSSPKSMSFINYYWVLHPFYK